MSEKEWRRVRGVLHAAALLDLVGFGLVVPLVPWAVTAAGHGPEATGLVVAGYAGAQLLTAPVLGRWADQRGRRWVIALSLAGNAMAMLLTAVSLRWPSLGGMLVARALAGASAGNLATLQLVVLDVSPPEQQAARLGRLSATMAIGVVLGPLLGGWLGEVARPLPAVVAMIVALASLGWTAARLPETRPRAGSKAGSAEVVEERRDEAGRTTALALTFTAQATPAALQVIVPLEVATHLSTASATRRTGEVFALFGLVLVATQGGGLAPLERRLGLARLAWLGPALMGVGLTLAMGSERLAPRGLALVLLGVGTGLSAPVATALMARSGGAWERGAAMSRQQMTATVARMVGPALVGAVISRGSSQLGLGCLATMALVTAVGARRNVVARRRSTNLLRRSIMSQLCAQHRRALVQQVARYAARRGLGREALGAQTGLSPGRVRELFDEAHAVPGVGALQRLVLALETPVESLVELAPDAPSAAELFGRGRGERLKVVVCGAGNLGHVFSGVLAAREGFEVALLTATAGRAAELRAAMGESGGIHVESRQGVVVGRPEITHEAAAVVPGADVVLLCLPSFREPEVLATIAPHVREGALLVSVPGPGGVQWAAREALGSKRVTVSGLASIPWMCKVDRPGQRVRVLGTKTISGLATPDRERSAWACDVVTSLVQFPIVDIGNFLQIIFNPANQVLHPGLMFDRFGDWDGRPLPEPPLFYEGASASGAAVVQAMSDEIVALRAAIEARRPGFDLSAVMPIELGILVAYGQDVADASSLQAILRTNRAYAGIRTPMTAVDGGWVPSWQSRFFLEDIPYGLVVVKGVAELAGVPTPMIDRVTAWAQGRMERVYVQGDALTGPDVSASGAPQRYGYRSLDALLDDEEPGA